jgi:hypothetical protein
LGLSKAPKDAPETIGDPVPQNIELHALPPEVASKVSQARSHSFFMKEGDNAIQFRVHPPGGPWAKLAKADHPQDGQAHAPPRIGPRRQIPSEIKRMEENRTIFEGDVLEVKVRSGRWMLVHAPAGPRPAPSPAQHYFPTEE